MALHVSLPLRRLRPVRVRRLRLTDGRAAEVLACESISNGDRCVVRGGVKTIRGQASWRQAPLAKSDTSAYICVNALKGNGGARRLHWSFALLPLTQDVARADREHARRNHADPKAYTHSFGLAHLLGDRRRSVKGVGRSGTVVIVLVT